MPDTCSWTGVDITDELRGKRPAEVVPATQPRLVVGRVIPRTEPNPAPRRRLRRGALVVGAGATVAMAGSCLLGLVALAWLWRHRFEVGAVVAVVVLAAVRVPAWRREMPRAPRRW